MKKGFIYLKMTVTQRKREIFYPLAQLQVTTTARAAPGQSQEPKASSGSPKSVWGAKTGQSCTAFPEHKQGPASPVETQTCVPVVS